MAYVTQTNTAFNALTLDVSSKLNHAFRAWQDYRAYRNTVVELRELNNHQLADLGLNRSMIRTVAREAIYGV